MGRAGATFERAKDQVGGAAHEAASRPWVEGISRLGYIIRGVLYIIIGVLAVRLAAGKGDAKTDQVGAISAIAAQPFGKFILIAVAVGLIGYAISGIVRAIMDPQHKGSDAKGLATRAAYALGGIGYGLLAIPTIRFIITGSMSQSGGDASAQDWTARFMSAPFGPWLVGIAGVAFLIGALVHFYIAFTARFREELMLERAGYDQSRWVTRAGQAGYAALGVVFGLVGFFLIAAALQHDPKQAKGLDGALHSLIQEPYGTWLLGIVALGLVCYGIYSILAAKWIKVR